LILDWLKYHRRYKKYEKMSAAEDTEQDAEGAKAPKEKRNYENDMERLSDSSLKRAKIDDLEKKCRLLEAKVGVESVCCCICIAVL
jgi:hypothetical protein